MSDLENTPVILRNQDLRTSQPRPDHSLLAKLGFADEDRRSPLHDLACQYLAQVEIATRVVALALKEETHEIVWLVPEFQVTKGYGAYKTTVGFADLLIRTSQVVTSNGAKLHHNLVIEVKTGKIIVSDVVRQLEVYTSYVAQAVFGEWVIKEPQRFHLYDIQKHVGRPGFAEAIVGPISAVLVTVGDLTASEASLLAARHIAHLKLGSTFDTWRKEQTTAPRAPSLEI